MVYYQEEKEYCMRCKTFHLRSFDCLRNGHRVQATTGPKQLNAHAQEFVVSEQSLALNHQDQIARPENTLPKTPANPVKAKAMAFLNSIAAEADSRPASRTTTPIAIRPQYMGNNTFPSHAPASYEVRPVGYPGHNMAQQPAWNPFGATIVTGPLLQPTRAAVVPNTRANITAGSIECFYCGLPGHWKQFCPSRRCAVCGHAGHIADSCPFDADNCKERRLCYTCHQKGHYAHQCLAGTLH